MTDINGRSLPEGSPILAMHGRYEKSWEAFNVLDREATAAADTTSATAYRYKRTMARLQSETDMLRAAILHQTPMDATDAMVMLFHAATLNDMAGGNAQQADQGRQLLDYGLAAVLNFMATTVHQDHERIGKQFQALVGTAFFGTELIAGNIEGQELTDDSGWDEAVATYRAARSAVEGADSAALGDEAFDVLVDVQTEALTALLAIPAPNGAALTYKLEIIDQEGWHERPEVWPAIIHEARRLGTKE